MAEVSRPPPPKRPTIIRPQDTQTTEKGDDAPKRPAPPHGPGRPPPKPPNRPLSFKDSSEHKEETESVQLRHPSNKPQRPVTMASKNESSAKRKIEITIVSARPMSEVGFRDMSGSQIKSEGKVEASKPVTTVKMSPPTSLVPDRNSLPPRPSKADASSHQRPPPPVPLRKDGLPDRTVSPSESPSPKPRVNKPSPESPSPKPRSNVPCPESSPPLLPRKCVASPARPLPPSPSPSNDEAPVVSECPAKPQRMYIWSLEDESENMSQSSISDKPKRPTIIRPSKMNKSVDIQKEDLSSQNQKPVSAAVPNDAVITEPVHHLEKQNDSENSQEFINLGQDKCVKNVITKKLSTDKGSPVSDDIEDKKKPPVAPKPSVLPKPKLRQQANVSEDDNVVIKQPVGENESRQISKPTIIRPSKQISSDKNTTDRSQNSLEDVSDRSQNSVKDVPDYASIKKPLTDKSPPVIKLATPSEKPPPPVPAKRFAPPSLKSQDDIEIQKKTDNHEENVASRPKPVARTRPMSMMVSSTTRVESSAKSPTPTTALSAKSPPPKPSPPCPSKSSTDIESPVKVSITQKPTSQPETNDRSSQDKVPPSRPAPIYRSKVTSQQEVQSEDTDEITKSKPVRPKAGPSRPLNERIHSTTEDHGLTDNNNVTDKTVGSAPDLPTRPGPGHPLYHYMLKVPHGQALYDYEATSPEDLSFKANDIIVLHKKIDEAWLHGQVGEAHGIFPQSFIQILRPFDNEVSPDILPIKFSDSDSSPATSVTEKSDWVGSGPRCVARFDFEGEGATDLCFEEGDFIRLLDRVDNEWIKGELHGKVGIFPMTFVEVIEDLPALSTDYMNDLVTSEEAANIADNSKTEVLKSSGIHTESPSICTMCQAMADFPGESSDDLSFVEGDIIEITGEIDENWLRGRLKNKEGIFPASFVTVLKTNAFENKFLDRTASYEEVAMGEAIYDFYGENDNELSFKTGDKIRLGATVDGADDWQWGEIEGQTGIFPKSFVNVVS